MFKISHQTVKNWAKEFQAYLSPTATPAKKRQRVYVDDDIRVFALVSELKNQGNRYDEIHAALGAGQRGDIPPNAGEIIPSPPPAQIAIWQERARELETQIKAARTEADEQRGQVKLLKEQLTEARQEIKGLYKEIAKFEAGQGGQLNAR